MLAWQDMQVEPGNRQQFQQQAFTLTYLNHALLSYLSAFGAHREQQLTPKSELLKVANEILEALQAANQAVRSPQHGTNKDVKSILDHIRQQLKSVEHGSGSMPFTLLYNIADVTNQMLQQAQLIKQHDEHAPR